MSKLVLGREPVLWIGALQAAIALAVGFGLDLTNAQVGLVTAAAAAVLALVARHKVTPKPEA